MIIKKIIFVDDEEDLRILMKLYCKKYNKIFENDNCKIEPLFFLSPIDVIDYFKCNCNELDRICHVVTDIDMPLMNGIELVTFLKNEYNFTECSIVSANDINNYKGFVANKPLGFFHKPIDYKLFIESVIPYCLGK